MTARNGCASHASCNHTFGQFGQLLVLTTLEAGERIMLCDAVSL